jgi:hypothetical protein
MQFFKLYSTRYPSHHHTSLPHYKTARFSHLWLLKPSNKRFSTVSVTTLQCGITVPVGKTCAILRSRQDVPWMVGMVVFCLALHSSPDPSGLNQLAQNTCDSQSLSRGFHYHYSCEQNGWTSGGEYRQACGRWKQKCLREVYGSFSCGLNLAAINYGLFVGPLCMWTSYELEYK